MKPLILLFSLFLLSCGTRSKDLEKTTTKEQSVANQSTNINQSSQTEFINDERLSNREITDFNSQTLGTQSIQSLVLKNTGKCVDPGTVRYLNFTAKDGSKIEVPVDNNTELAFGNESNFKQEIQFLKTENETLKTENNVLKKHFKEVLNQNESLTKTIETSTKSNHVKSDRTSWATWLWFGIAIIAFWEFAKSLIKKYLWY